MITIRFRFPGVAKRVLKDVSLAASFSSFSACRIWAISNTISGSCSSPVSEWYRASTLAAFDSCIQRNCQSGPSAAAAEGRSSEKHTYPSLGHKEARGFWDGPGLHAVVRERRSATPVHIRAEAKRTI